MQSSDTSSSVEAMPQKRPLKLGGGKQSKLSFAQQELIAC